MVDRFELCQVLLDAEAVAATDLHSLDQIILGMKLILHVPPSKFDFVFHPMIALVNEIFDDCHI